MAKARGRQSGLAAVEFAIVLPVIVLIAFAMTELGRGLYQYNTLSKAVHAAARFLADDVFIGNPGGDIATILAPGSDLYVKAQQLVATGTTDGIGNEILYDFSSRGSVTIRTLNIVLKDGNGTDHNHIEVSATYTFLSLIPGLSALGYSMLPNFTAKAVERALMI